MVILGPRRGIVLNGVYYTVSAGLGGSGLVSAALFLLASICFFHMFYSAIDDSNQTIIIGSIQAHHHHDIISQQQLCSLAAIPQLSL